MKDIHRGIDKLYRYQVMNPYEGRMAEQGGYKTKAKALREAKASYERNMAAIESEQFASHSLSRMFFVLDTETGEIIGGMADPNIAEMGVQA